MKKILIPVLVYILAVSSAFAGNELEQHQEFDVIYNVYRSGLKVAKMQRRLSRDADENTLYSETTTTGLISLFRNDRIIEKSTWQNIDGKPVPKFYEYIRTGGKKARNVTVEFDWNKNQITNSVNGSSWKMPAAEGILDKLLYQYSIMLDLKEGKSKLVYTIADGGKEKVYTFETMGEEMIDTPLGEMRTVKLKRVRNDSDRQSIFWSAPEMNYLPVKLEIIDDGEKTIVLIDSLKGIKTAPDGELVLN